MLTGSSRLPASHYCGIHSRDISEPGRDAWVRTRSSPTQAFRQTAGRASQADHGQNKAWKFFCFIQDALNVNFYKQEIFECCRHQSWSTRIVYLALYKLYQQESGFNHGKSLTRKGCWLLHWISPSYYVATSHSHCASLKHNNNLMITGRILF